MPCHDRLPSLRCVMEEIAWRYVQRGDLHSAMSLFETLNRTFSSNRSESPRRTSLLPSLPDGKYGRLSRLCRVLLDPLAVPLPHRHTDVVDAFLEERFPITAFFGVQPEAFSRQIQRWLLLLHPDKNPHPRARDAFLRLAELKGKLLVPDGEVLPDIRIPVVRKESLSDIRTPLPLVRNPLRAARDQRKKQEQLSSLLSTLKKHPMRRLRCDLSFSSFEKTIGEDRLAKTTDDVDVDESDSTDLDATIVANGISHSDCSEKVKKAVSELLCTDTHLAATTGGIGMPRRIVLRRPPTLDEWRKGQPASPCPQVNITIESRHIESI